MFTPGLTLDVWARFISGDLLAQGVSRRGLTSHQWRHLYGNLILDEIRHRYTLRYSEHQRISALFTEILALRSTLEKTHPIELKTLPPPSPPPKLPPLSEILAAIDRLTRFVHEKRVDTLLQARLLSQDVDVLGPYWPKIEEEAKVYLTKLNVIKDLPIRPPVHKEQPAPPRYPPHLQQGRMVRDPLMPRRNMAVPPRPMMGGTTRVPLQRGFGAPPPYVTPPEEWLQDPEVPDVREEFFARRNPYPGVYRDDRGVFFGGLGGMGDASMRRGREDLDAQYRPRGVFFCVIGIFSCLQFVHCLITLFRSTSCSTPPSFSVQTVSVWLILVTSRAVFIVIQHPFTTLSVCILPSTNIFRFTIQFLIYIHS
ncbi:hypothetical protein BT69DRAFT_41839 [Atractiella rhizophila]|nr:hypothetical protein BT69DRAFT_41839 [Atractiella rhizophila]